MGRRRGGARGGRNTTPPPLAVEQQRQQESVATIPNMPEAFPVAEKEPTSPVLSTPSCSGRDNTLRDGATISTGTEERDDNTSCETHHLQQEHPEQLVRVEYPEAKDEEGAVVSEAAVEAPTPPVSDVEVKEHTHESGKQQWNEYEQTKKASVLPSHSTGEEEEKEKAVRAAKLAKATRTDKRCIKFVEPTREQIANRESSIIVTVAPVAAATAVVVAAEAEAGTMTGATVEAVGAPAVAPVRRVARIHKGTNLSTIGFRILMLVVGIVISIILRRRWLITM